MLLSEFKAKNPAYAEVPDSDLVDFLHTKYYSDIPKDEFSKAVGFDFPTVDKPWYSDAYEIGRQIGAGGAVDLPRMAGQALQALSPEDSGITETGKEWVAGAEARAPEWEPDMEGRGPVASALIRGGRAIPPSIATIAAYLNPAGKVLGPAATIALFGGSQYQETYDKIKAAGGTDEDANEAALLTGAVQGVGETVANKLTLGVFGAGKKVAAEGVKGFIGKTVDTSVVKPWAKATGLAMVGEPATEISQDVGTAAIERAYGLETQDYGEIAKESGTAAVGMTVLLAPFGLAGHYKNSKRAEAIDKILSSPDSATPQERAAVASMIFADAQRLKIPEADTWFKGALRDIEAKAPIRRVPEDPDKDVSNAVTGAPTLDAAIQAASEAAMGPDLPTTDLDFLATGARNQQSIEGISDADRRAEILSGVSDDVLRDAAGRMAAEMQTGLDRGQDVTEIANRLEGVELEIRRRAKPAPVGLLKAAMAPTDIAPTEARRLPVVQPPRVIVTSEGQAATEAQIVQQRTAQAQRERDLGITPDIRRQIEKTTPAPKTPTKADIHALAEQKHIPYDNDPDFLQFTQEITGKQHLDDLTEAETQAVYTKLAERPEQVHKYSSSQVAVKGDIGLKLRKAAKNLIAAEDVHPEEGLEKRPHITLKYGLRTEAAADLEKVLAGEGPITATVGNIEIFQPKDEDYDVVVARVESPELTRLNKKVSDALPNVSTHPDYKPHITLGYVKKGTGQKYAKAKTGLEGKTLTFKAVEFGGKDGTITPIELKGQAAPTTNELLKTEELVDFLSGMNEQIGAGESNADLLPTFDTEAFENLLKENGWTRDGKYWRKGKAELFIRSQGDLARPIVQWSVETKSEPPTTAPVAESQAPETSETGEDEVATVPDDGGPRTDDFGAKWDAMDYGARQNIAQASDIRSMRNVVHRISGSKWSALSEGERKSMQVAAQKSTEPKTPESTSAKAEKARRSAERIAYTEALDNSEILEEAKGDLAAFDQAAAELQESTQEKPKAAQPGEPTLPAKSKPATERTVSGLAADAAKLGVKGIDEALKGLVELFGGGKIKSFPAGFDEESYRKAKPHFEAALNAFQDAGKTLVDLFKFLIEKFGLGIRPYAERFAKDQKLSMGLGAAPSASRQIATWVKDEIKAGNDIRWQDLFEQSDKAYGGTQAEGKYTVKDAYDAMEAGVNLYIQDGGIRPASDLEGAARDIRNLSRLLDGLPTQTKRTGEMDEFQQFSTPPTLAYAASWAANIRYGESMLEPSAGIGGLAIFADLAGARVTLNELSSRRAAVLKEVLPNARVFQENAEQLHNVLPDDVTPSVIVMNPPFSATAGRMEGTRKTAVGAQHIEQALKRLAKNGRLVAIVGEGMGADKSGFRDWWKQIQGEYNVRANIGVSGKNYAKYGTTFDNQLLIIDKTGPTTGDIVTGKADTIEELIRLVEGVRNDRPATDQAGEPVAAQPGGEEVPAEGIAGQGGVARPEPDALGTGQRPGTRTDVTEPSDAGEAGGAAQPARADETQPGAQVPDRSGRGDRPGRGRTGKSGRTEAGGEPAAGDTAQQYGGDSAVKLEQAEKQKAEGEITEAIFEAYTPQRLKITGAQPHPGKLVQSAAMAAVEPPAPTYTPNLPREVITEGKLSLAQIEAVVYAGQAHQQTLPDGSRRGFFIGDGTGVGKGREIAGIILDNLRQGRKKAVWISEKRGLFKDAGRDFAGVGGDKTLLFQQHKFPATGKVSPKGGILFSTYSMLRSGEKKQATDKDKVPGKTRVAQLVEWLGEDFDGVVVFDESHNMANAVQTKGKRGKKDASKQAKAGIELQRLLPKARVVYVSATGATEVENLIYAQRLGLWGEGTAFSGANDFVTKVSTGGVAAMELVARDLKALGSYIARSLSFDGVTYERLEHELTPLQTDIYNELAKAWGTVLQHINEALEATLQGKNGNAKSAAMSRFWSTEQRFFNQVITSMQMPTILEDARKRLDNGEAVVLQLVNTNEAEQERQVARAEQENIEIEELDFTPRQALMDYVRFGFPVQQYEEYTDEEGDTQTRPVFDSQGKPVINKQMVDNRDTLLKVLEDILVPDNPIDIILETFGPKMVGEVTGRGRRFYRKQGEDGEFKMVEEKRTASAAQADAQAFMDDQKRVLVFSDAGGTGYSFHADKTQTNQRRRYHYLVQPGWRADKAVQGFGRTHRTNQANEPHYVLPTTSLKAQKRFISSIARRLDQLGALTKGQRQASGQGLFNAADNLESKYASEAMQLFFEDLYAGRTPLDLNETLSMMGLEGVVDAKTGALNETKIPSVPQFLNRLLALTTDKQNEVFDEFFNRMEELVHNAIQKGTYDQGVETLKALNVHKLRDEVAYTDPRTGAETRYVELETTLPTEIHEWDAVQNRADLAKKDFAGYFRNNKTGKVFAMIRRGVRTGADGRQLHRALQIHVTGPHRYIDNAQSVEAERQSLVFPSLDKEAKVSDLSEADMSKGKPHYEKLDDAQAQDAWSNELETAPKTHTKTVHMIAGAILPIWDRVSGQPKVIRTQTDEGERLLGRVVAGDDLKATLRNLGIGSSATKMTPAQVLKRIQDGDYALLANGWQIREANVSGDDRIEITAPSFSPADRKLLEEQGAFIERIQWRERVFIPTGDQAEGVLDRIIKSKPVVEIIERGGKAEFSLAARLKPSENVQYEATETEPAADLRRGVQTALGRPLKKGSFTQVGVPEHLRGLTEVIEKLFKKKVVYFRNNIPDIIAFNGMAPRHNRTTMYLNIESERPLVYVAGHELLHLLRRENKDIYNKLYRMALDEFKPEQVTIFTKNLDAARQRNKQTGKTTEDLVHEEMMANFLGDQFGRPEFWNALYKESPNLLQRLALLVRNFVTSILKAAKLRGFGAENYFKDLERMRQAAVDALSEYSRKQGTAIEEMVDGGEFSFRDGSLEMPFVEGPPSKEKVEAMKKWLSEHSDLYKNEYVTLYHGTGQSVPILSEGLKNTSASRRRSYQSRSGYVYLAPTIERARTFGDLGNQSKSTVYGVRVLVRKLLADTDQLNNLRSTGVDVGNSVAESIVYGGSVRVKGPIAQNDIFDVTETPAEFSLADTFNTEEIAKITGDSGRAYTDEQIESFKRLGRETVIPPLKERVKALWKDAGKKLAQGLVDQFSPVKELSQEAYELIRLSKGASGAFQVFLKGGKLKLTDNTYDFDESARGGVIQRLLIPLQAESDDFMWWVAANRAEQLSAEDRENLFSADDIGALKALDNGTTEFDYTLQHGANAGQVTRNRTLIYDDALKTFNEFNKNALDMAEQSGLIDGESRQFWEKEFYVPFYRVDEEEGLRGINIKSGVVRQQAFKRLKGGTQKLNSDLLENTLMNWAHLLDAAAKNRAAKATLEAAEQMGVAHEAEWGEKKTVWYMGEYENADGERKFGKIEYKVDDPHVLTAISAIEYSGMKGPLMDAMSEVKHWLTIGVTASPFYKVRNLIRDSVHSIGVSSLSYNVAGNITKGYALTHPESDNYFRLLAGGGTIHFGTMLEGSESRRVRALVEAGVDKSTILDNEGKIKAFYKRMIEPAITAYNEIGNRGEAINRASLYDQLIRQGKSHREASFLARDLMDFSMGGSWSGIRFLTQTVPFMNARLQGLYKLGRSAKDDPNKLAVVLGATAVLSIALMLAYEDDDDWKKREDFDRDTYWWFKIGGIAYRIPKPFEIGSIASLAERGVELFSSDEMTGQRFRSRLYHLLADNLAFNPVPQLVKPVLDIYANKDSFTGRPIESMGMERLQPGYRYTARTSMAARGLSTAGNVATGDHFASPVQVDHLIRGYFGWLGSFVVGVADKLARPATGQPGLSRPDYWKLATGGMIADTGSASSRYVSQMYEQAKEIERAYATWNSLRKEGKIEEAAEFRKENLELIRKYHPSQRAKRQETKLNERIKMIERSSKSSDEKRRLIDQLRHQKDVVARRISASQSP